MTKFFLMMTVLLSFAVMGCETLGGAGRDIEKAGEAVQDAAN